MTINDVARACGLSKGTVSKALNLPEGKCPLLPSTRARVLETAGRLGYQASWYARALVKRRTRLIGIVYSRPFRPAPRWSR